jgi:hypothetical protein
MLMSPFIYQYVHRHCDFNMQVALRKSDYNATFMKAVPSRQKNRVPDISNPILGIIDSHSQLQIDGTVTEFPYKAFRFRDL